MVLQVCLGKWDKKVLKDHQDSQALQVCQVLENLDHLDFQEKGECPEPQVQQAKRENQGQWVTQVRQVLLAK